MKLEQRRQAMLQLHLSDQQFHCLIRCGLYQRLDGKCKYIMNHGCWVSAVIQVHSSSNPYGIINVQLIHELHHRASANCPKTTWKYSICYQHIVKLSFFWQTVFISSTKNKESGLCPWKMRLQGFLANTNYHLRRTNKANRNKLLICYNILRYMWMYNV